MTTIFLSLQLDGSIVLFNDDPSVVSQILDMFLNSRRLEYKPQTHNITGDFILCFETKDSGCCCIQLDLAENLFLASDGFYYYGEPNTEGVKELWKLLGIEQWPDAVYEKYGWFFDANGISYKK